MTEFQCAICYEDCTTEAIMPCCHNPNSSLKYCTDCISIICETPPGRCPTCRSCISYNSTNGTVTINEEMNQCRICRQNRTIVDERRQICEGCLLGRQFCFNYECDGCHRIQKIPHPMWKYQVKPTEMSTETWACNLGCLAQTHWKIISDQVGLIPPEHCPETWGRREEWLAAVREERRARLRGNRVCSLRPWRVWVFVLWFALYVGSGGKDNQGVEISLSPLGLEKIQLSTLVLVVGLVGGVVGVRCGYV